MPFEAVHGAGYRAVYDFSDLDNSRFAIPLGQSGNMLSRWSHNFVEGWKKLRYVEIAGTRAELGPQRRRHHHAQSGRPLTIGP